MSGAREMRLIGAREMRLIGAREMRLIGALVLMALSETRVCLAQQAAGIISDDSAVYVTLIAPELTGGRGRAVGRPIDLRRAKDGASVGRALAGNAPGFDPALVAALHRAAPDGRGPAVALRGRPALLWRAPTGDSARMIKSPSFADGTMERVETDPRRISLGFSVVQYSSDRQWAVVLELLSCGPLCGTDRYVVLRRGKGGAWAVVTELVVGWS